MPPNNHIHTYARWQPIYDVAGRQDYLTNPRRQENLLAVSGETSVEFWKQLSVDAQQAWRESGGTRQKTVKKRNSRTGSTRFMNADKHACEALEIQLALPGKILNYSPEQQKALLDDLVELLRSKHGIVVLAAMHLSKTDNNVHVHILYADRLRLREPHVKYASRNVFLDEHGFRKRTKREVLDAAGNIRPGCKVVPKGSVIREQHFGDKDPMLSSPTWIHVCKEDLTSWINETLQPDKERVLFDPTGPYLAQEHIGKGVPDKKRSKIENYNAEVRAFNAAVGSGVLNEFEAQQIKTQVLLAPQRTSALGGALAALLLSRPDLRPYFAETLLGRANHTALKEIALVGTGGTRKQEDMDSAAKEQLRNLYREAARYRQLVRSTESEVDRQMYYSKARQCSLLIDRQRRKLSLFTDEDYKKKIRSVNEALSRSSRYLSSLRSSVNYAYNCILWKEREIAELEAELNSLPLLFKTKQSKEREAQLQSLIQKAQAEAKQLELNYSRHYAKYYFAQKEAKATKAELSKERKELRAERRSLKRGSTHTLDVNFDK